MGNHHKDRIQEDIARELTAILRTVKDPRVTAEMISILRVEVSSDLSYATVHITALGGLDAAKAAAEGLKSAAGYMRRSLGNALQLRHVPELRFIPDDSIAYSAHIEQKLLEIERQKEERDHA